ncbi:efflux RND transporter periplasmic adaptor subunit [Sulfurimonas paralvinellae]|uniref:Efflux RND transporter periplasmic adaptor subunit n=1 Tax=Sulfurimonas paralvinellae TaxID=317658 RepID=A0A7M1BA50_9BACT|nr:efflux RND transporter periplasmic adaptor subunit [Sulfurimonas paralvinellae]QOP45622.1 efflux RND transporter periplasmic adaptor subunit [Sulfurimonas paralvinellae]
MNNNKFLSLISMAALLLILSACGDQTTKKVKKELPPLKVKTITIETKKVPIWGTFTGKTRASSHQKVRARVSGILEKIYFKDGQDVKKGEKLFKIQQSEYIAALNAAKAKKAQDEAALELAKADVARYTPLVKDGLAPRATLEQYQAKLAALQAAILGDTAKINEAKIHLDYTIIRAPISGRVSARKVDVGNLIGQGESTLLTTIVKYDPLYAYFSPSQNDAMVMQKYKNKENPDAFIEYKGADEDIRLNGYIDFANNTVDPLTSTITMRAVIKNPEYKILPGTFVYVNVFISDKYKFKMIPPEIIMDDQLGKYVYIIDKNSTVKRADITTAYGTRYYVSVKKGLKDGDRVIVSGLMKVKPGVKVEGIDVTKEEGIDAILKNNNLIPTKE